jgi:hypothetical protein
MEDTDLSFSDSCEHFALDLPFCFIGSFPGFIVFGETNTAGFKRGKYLKFGVFQLYKLYLNIVKILSFFTNANEENEKGLILSENENYFWIGKVVHVNNKRMKIVQFGIEKDDNIIFEFGFFLKQFQQFFFGLQNVILSSMCLNEKQFIFIQYVLVEFSASDLSNVHKFDDALKIVKSFMKRDNQSNIQIKQQPLINLLMYYQEVVILLIKINSLKMPNFRHIVIQQIT